MVQVLLGILFISAAAGLVAFSLYIFPFWQMIFGIKRFAQYSRLRSHERENGWHWECLLQVPGIIAKGGPQDRLFSGDLAMPALTQVYSRNYAGRMEIWRQRLAKTLAALSFLCFAGALIAFNVALFPWGLIMIGVPVFIVLCREIAKRR